jgi:hypothetical protein
MSVLRNIASDLVEKKLWPVAVALVLALVALPVALRGGNEEAPAAPVVAADAVQKAPPVSLDETVSDKAKVRAGGVRDPFRQLNKPKLKPAKKAATTAATVTPRAGGGAAVTPAATPTATVPSTTPLPSVPSVQYFTWRVSLHFGKSGKLKRYGDVKRLTALPSSTFPFFTFMGVLEDESTAVFAVAADVSATGDGVCRPRKSTCQLLELEPGDSARLIYHPSDGRDPIAYRLQMGSIKRVQTTSKAKAARAHAAVNRKGSAAMKAMRAAKLLPMLNRYVFATSTGLLRRATGKRAAKAAAADAPKRVSEETRWGWIAKLDGGVFFSPSKSAGGS